MAVQRFTNNASGTLAALFDAPDLMLTLNAAEGALFPNPVGGDYFIATVEDNLGNLEVIKVTARAGDVFTTVERAQEGTVALAFLAGSRVECRLTAGAMDNLLQKSDGSLYFGAAKKLTTQLAGIKVWGRDVAGSKDAIIELFDDTGALRLGYLSAAQAAGALSLASEIHGALIQLRGENLAGADRVLIEADPDGAASLYYAGAERFKTMNAGAQVVGDRLNLLNGVSYLSVGASDETILSAIENGSVGVFWNGITKIATHSVGVNVYADILVATPPVAAITPNAVYNLLDLDGTDTLSQFGLFGTSLLYIINRIRNADIEIGRTDAAGNYQASFRAGELGTYLHQGGVLKFQTTSAGAVVWGTLNATVQLQENGVPVSLVTHTHSGLATKFATNEIALSASASGGIAHGLGVQPDYVIGLLRCVIGENGYVAGDELPINPLTNNGAVLSGIQVWASNAEVGYVMSQNISSYTIQKRSVTVGSTVAITLNNWRLIIRAGKFS